MKTCLANRLAFSNEFFGGFAEHVCHVCNGDRIEKCYRSWCNVCFAEICADSKEELFPATAVIRMQKLPDAPTVEPRDVDHHTPNDHWPSILFALWGELSCHLVCCINTRFCWIVEQNDLGLLLAVENTSFDLFGNDLRKSIKSVEYWKTIIILQEQINGNVITPCVYNASVLTYSVYIMPVFLLTLCT